MSTRPTVRWPIFVALAFVALLIVAAQYPQNVRNVYNAYKDQLPFLSSPLRHGPTAGQHHALDLLIASYQDEDVAGRAHETNSFKAPKTAVHTRQCDILTGATIDSLVEHLNPAEGPVAFYLHDGNIVDEYNDQFEVGDEFCSVFVHAQSPLPDLQDGQFQNMPIRGWGPDLIHGEIGSEDVRLMFPALDFWGVATTLDDHIFAVYTVAYTLNHPGVYKVAAEIEYEHYDWVMEDDTRKGKRLQLRYWPKEIIVTSVPTSISVTGIPVSRPVARCFGDGGTNINGRWYRGTSFSSSGSMTALNPNAHLEFADIDHLVDEWGWTFAPDRCSIEYFSPDDHMLALQGLNINFVAESHSRRLMKSILGGGVTWCMDKDDLTCQCDDGHQDNITDALGNVISTRTLKDFQRRTTPTKFGYNTTYWNDYIGGLMTHPAGNTWQDIFYSESGPTVQEQRVDLYGDFDIAHLSMLAWDIRDIIKPSKALTVLPEFRETFYGTYKPGTRFITRLTHATCCGTFKNSTRYNMNRFAMWNEMWRQFWVPDEESGIMVIYDASVLQGRRDAMKYLPCWQAHMRGSHTRIEQMIWMNIVFEKDDDSVPYMKEWSYDHALLEAFHDAGAGGEEEDTDLETDGDEEQEISS